MAELKQEIITRDRHSFEQLIQTPMTFEIFMAHWVLNQEEFNSDTTNELKSIFAHLKEEKQKNDSQLQVQSAYNTFNEVGRIGEQFNKRSLVKVAEAGRSLVGMSAGIMKAGEQLGMTFPAISSFFEPLAALDPTFMIISAGIALASLCGLGRRRRSKGLDLSPIMHAMQTIQESVIHVLNAVKVAYQEVIHVRQDIYKVRQDIYKLTEMVAKLGDILIQDVKFPLMATLSSVEDSLQRLHVISGQEHRELYLQPLSTLINRFSDYADGVMTLEEKDLTTLLTDLHEWFGTQSSAPLLTGVNYLRTGVNRNEVQWVKQVLNNPKNNPVNLVGYLAGKAEEIAGKKLPDINKALLMNVNVWVKAVNNYLLGLSSVDLKKYHPAKVLDGITAQVDNYLKFIHYLSSSEDLYKNLFGIYNESVQGINTLVKKKFAKMQSNPPEELPNGPLTFEQLFPQDSGDRKELDPCLDLLDDFHLLFHIYTVVGGIKELYEETTKHLLTRKKIFSYREDDFYNRTYRGPAWGNQQGFGAPKHYQTIRTSIFSLNGKPVFIGLVRQHGGITVDLYDLSTNIASGQSKSVEPLKKLAGLPATNNPYPWGDLMGYTNPIYYNSIRMNVITLNGQPKIYVMAMHEEGFQLFSCDPQTNHWTKLTDAPLGVASGYEAVKLHNEVMTVFGQPRLYQLVTTAHGSKLIFYDPENNKWLDSVPAVPQNGVADWENSLKTNVMEINGNPIFCKMTVNTNGFRLDLYDPITNTWFPPVLAPVGKASGYDFNTLHTAVLTIGGQQKLYVAIWHSLGLQLNVYDPQKNKNTFELLAEGPPWRKDHGYDAPQYKTTIRLQAILLNGQQKLLGLIRHSMGYQKNIYDPLTNTWEHIDVWPRFPDNGEWNEEKYYATIQTNVINITPEHQELFITARDSLGLRCCQAKVARQLFALSEKITTDFLQNLKKIQQKSTDALYAYRPHEIEAVLQMVKIHVELWKENIAILNKSNSVSPDRPKGTISSNIVDSGPSPSHFSSTKELSNIVKQAEQFYKRLIALSSGVTDREEQVCIKEYSETILESVRQLKSEQNPTRVITLLKQLITGFNNIDASLKCSLKDYSLSKNVQIFIESIQDHLKTIIQHKPSAPSIPNISFFRPENPTKAEDVKRIQSEIKIKSIMAKLLAKFSDSSEIPQPRDQDLALALQNCANDFGFACKNVGKDGNCFFYAVLDQLEADRTVDELRAIVVREIVNHPQTYFGFVDNNDLDSYVDKMIQNKVWVDNIAITALSNAMHMTIYIIRSDGHLNVIEYPSPEIEIYLGYEVGLHYQSLHKDPKIEHPKQDLHKSLVKESRPM